MVRGDITVNKREGLQT